MKEGSPVSEHMIKIMGFGQRLTQLGFPIPESLGIHIVLMSLPTSFKSFAQNYQMDGMDKSVNELLAMLKNAETTMQTDPNYTLAVSNTPSFKKKAKAKGKGAGKPGAKTKKPSGTVPNKDTKGFYCKAKGHWKRKCKKYLADKKKTGFTGEGIKVIYVIDVYLSGPHSKSWVFDTGAVAHICNSLQGLKRTRRLEKNEVTMRVGNGATISAKAVGVYTLHLPSGFTIELENFYFVPAICKNIMSGSCLIRDGYNCKSENNGCSVYLKNVFYGFAPIKNGLFYLDLDC